jgi:YggT family protein
MVTAPDAVKRGAAAAPARPRRVRAGRFEMDRKEVGGLRDGGVKGTVARFRRSADCCMHALVDLILTLIQIYIWLLIAQAVLSWLVAFNVVNRHNNFVSTVGEFLYRITEPVLRPIRSFLPNFGGIDISPIIVILILHFVRVLIIDNFYYL